MGQNERKAIRQSVLEEVASKLAMEFAEGFGTSAIAKVVTMPSRDAATVALLAYKVLEALDGVEIAKGTAERFGDALLDAAAGMV